MATFDPFNMNSFWKMCINAQEVNQLAFKAFLNAQKINSSQNLLEQFVKECMACVADNTTIANQLFQALSSVKKPEDLLLLQEKVFAEYSERNIEHTKKLLSMYNDLLQESYYAAKKHAESFAEDCVRTSQGLAKEVVDNINHAASFANNYGNFAEQQYSNKQQNPFNKKTTQSSNERGAKDK